ncbi:MAG: hypothetical protein ACOC2D_17840 [Spirochaetota bacterium]
MLRFPCGTRASRAPIVRDDRLLLIKHYSHASDHSHWVLPGVPREYRRRALSLHRFVVAADASGAAQAAGG